MESASIRVAPIAVACNPAYSVRFFVADSAAKAIVPYMALVVPMSVHGPAFVPEVVQLAATQLILARLEPMGKDEVRRM